MRKMTLLSIFLAYSLSVVAQNDSDIVSKDFTIVDVSASAKKANAADLAKLENARPLSELNANERAEAYPFLTEDGLRLYFTRELDGKSVIMLSERANTTAPFGEAVVQSFNMDDANTQSCWLSADELTIFFTTRVERNHTLYKATRADITENFATPVAIDLGREDLGHFSCPSLSQDGKQLYLHQLAEGARIIEFELVGEHKYAYKGSLRFTDDMHKVTPGQLSTDGLSFYCIDRKTSELYVLHRASLEDEFQFQKKIELGANFHQVAIRGNWMLLTHSTGKKWADNDLYIADWE